MNGTRPSVPVHRAVLVHGIFNSGYVFCRLRKHLEASGITCFVPTLKPRDGRRGVADWAMQLKNQIDRHFDDSAPINLVGFSMGGVICRYYIQKLGGHLRSERLFTVSAPHHGSYLAWCYPGKGTRDLRPNSALLRSLREDESYYRNMQVYSYWTPFDLMILPPASSVWSVAENRRCDALLHLLMLFNRSMTDHIIHVILGRPVK